MNHAVVALFATVEALHEWFEESGEGGILSFPGDLLAEFVGACEPIEDYLERPPEEAPKGRKKRKGRWHHVVQFALKKRKATPKMYLKDILVEYQSENSEDITNGKREVPEAEALGKAMCHYDA